MIYVPTRDIVFQPPALKINPIAVFYGVYVNAEETKSDGASRQILDCLEGFCVSDKMVWIKR